MSFSNNNKRTLNILGGSCRCVCHDKTGLLLQQKYAYRDKRNFVFVTTTKLILAGASDN